MSLTSTAVSGEYIVAHEDGSVSLVGDSAHGAQQSILMADPVEVMIAIINTCKKNGHPLMRNGKPVTLATKGKKAKR